MCWTLMVPDYSMLQLRKKQETKQSFEMAYSSMMNRAWLEVQKFVLQFITFSAATVLKKVTHVFFRMNSKRNQAAHHIFVALLH